MKRQAETVYTPDAHDPHQVMHLDVKPANFLIRSKPANDDYPDLLLSDFGIARLASTISTSSNQHVRGTPLYMAPEQWASKPTFASDQYALAILAYELLAGAPPFQGAPMQVMFAHLQEQPPSLCERNPRLSSDVDLVLQRALAKKPEERFPSIAEFAQMLQKTLQREPEEKTLPKEETITATPPEADHVALSLFSLEQTSPLSLASAHPLAQETPTLPPATSPRMAIHPLEPVTSSLMAPTEAADSPQNLTASPLITHFKQPKRSHPAVVMAVIVLLILLLGGTSGGMYYFGLRDQTPTLSPIQVTATTFHNFAYQISMTLNTSCGGGILFRGNKNTDAYYLFTINVNGTYLFEVYGNNTNNHATLASGNSSAILGVGQTNALAVIANQSVIDLFVNQTFVGEVNDTSLQNTGQIGVAVYNTDQHASATFNNAKVWKL